MPKCGFSVKRQCEPCQPKALNSLNYFAIIYRFFMCKTIGTIYTKLGEPLSQSKNQLVYYTEAIVFIYLHSNSTNS